MRRLFLSSLCVLCAVIVWAQDTVVSLPTVDTVALHPKIDTLRLNDINNRPQLLDADELMLQLIAQQSRDIHIRDSLALDSTYQDLLRREAELFANLAIVRDSLMILRPQMPEVQARLRDSVLALRDSVARELVNADRATEVVVERGLIRDPAEDLRDIQRAIRYSNSPWHKEATILVQFTQNYISPNWYKGGNSNFALLSILKGSIDYRKDKIAWENTGEWRTGVTTVTGDSLRKYNFTDDLFRLYSKFGYEIAKNLSVSSSADFQTNFFYVWNANQRTAKTALFTPIKFNLTVGLDYKPVKNLSIMFSPLAYKMVYAYRGDSVDMIDVTSYGIEAGKKILNEVGSSMRVQYRCRPLREIALDTEFYLFTNYHRVELDWEINCNFIINRFLSARLTLHPRFDNTILSKDDKAHLQFKELLSIGFAHRFH